MTAYIWSKAGCRRRFHKTVQKSINKLQFLGAISDLLLSWMKFCYFSNFLEILLGNLAKEFSKIKNYAFVGTEGGPNEASEFIKKRCRNINWNRLYVRENFHKLWETFLIFRRHFIRNLENQPHDFLKVFSKIKEIRKP